MINLRDKPFALVGVNIGGHDAKSLKRVMDKEKLTWQSFADSGEIAARWNLSATPTFYLIDAKGVIRRKWAGSPGAKAIDAALDELIREAEGGGKAVPK